MLQNLVTGNTDEYHISRLRPFYCENEYTPKQTANRDNQEWDVDFIVDHAGDKSSRKTLQLSVRWVGYGETDDTWQPYADLRHRKILDIMWIEGLSTGDNYSFFVRSALVLVLCYEMLLLSHFSISEVLLQHSSCIGHYWLFCAVSIYLTALCHPDHVTSIR